MRRLAPAAAVAALCTLTVFAEDKKREHKTASSAGLVTKGRYLVEDVAKCVDCHTPSLEHGESDKTHWLKGTKLAFEPVHPMPDWKGASPDITSSGSLWARYGEAGFQKFLETGAFPDGERAGPPMPAYHLGPRDARAVVEYLKSLK